MNNPTIKLILMFIWLMGIVVAKGFWSTLLAIIFPLWGLYLSVEHFVIWVGLL